MNTPRTRKANPPAIDIDIDIDIDALLQDSLLLVVKLRQGSQTTNGPELWALCCSQVESVRRTLEEGGLGQRDNDYIVHAQCALLDETVLACASPDAHAVWAAQPLQTRFFSRHQAGDSLYEDMRAVLNEAHPNVRVLATFQRVLTLGFMGRYRDADDPERLRLLEALNDRVGPFAPSMLLSTETSVRRATNMPYWLQTPVAQGVLAALLLIGCWWALDTLLDLPALPVGQGPA